MYGRDYSFLGYDVGLNNCRCNICVGKGLSGRTE
jgi:hypothetical protein